MLATMDRRDRLNAAIAEMAADSRYTPVVTRLGCLRGISTLTAFGFGGRDRGLAAVERAVDRRLPRADARRVLLRQHPIAGIDHQDR